MFVHVVQKHSHLVWLAAQKLSGLLNAALSTKFFLFWWDSDFKLSLNDSSVRLTGIKVCVGRGDFTFFPSLFVPKDCG